MSWWLYLVCEDPNTPKRTDTHTAILVKSQFQEWELQSVLWMCASYFNTHIYTNTEPPSETQLPPSGQEEKGQEEREGRAK